MSHLWRKTLYLLPPSARDLTTTYAEGVRGMPLISIILSLIIVGVILYLITLIPMDAKVKQIIYVIAILAVVLWLVQVLFGIGPGINLR
jgi:hypothetical protein